MMRKKAQILATCKGLAEGRVNDPPPYKTDPEHLAAGSILVKLIRAAAHQSASDPVMFHPDQLPLLP